MYRWTQPKMDVDTNLPWHVQRIYTVRANSAEAQDSLHGWINIINNTFFQIGTERMTTNSLVPFRPFPCSLVGVKTRP